MYFYYLEIYNILHKFIKKDCTIIVLKILWLEQLHNYGILPIPLKYNTLSYEDIDEKYISQILWYFNRYNIDNKYINNIRVYSSAPFCCFEIYLPQYETWLELGENDGENYCTFQKYVGRYDNLHSTIFAINMNLWLLIINDYKKKYNK